MRSPSSGSEIVVELDAHVADWEIAPGQILRGWTFNGQVPGPTIEGKVGDTLVVRLTNNLPEPTTIHWHGLRLPAAMDGTHDAQPLVQPGETFEYRFTLPDAGTFWYHSHVNETWQVERGLHGALIVRARRHSEKFSMPGGGVPEAASAAADVALQTPGSQSSK